MKVRFQDEVDPHKVMARRGDNLIEETVVKQTSIVIELNTKRQENEFNVREAFRGLMNTMWNADNSVKVVSKSENKVWGPGDKLPIDNEFIKYFNVTESNTQYETKKVYVHVDVRSTEDINRIKWRPIVRDYIFNENIWVKEDKFEAQISSSPGYFIGLHPRATNREEFKKRIEDAIGKVEVDQQLRVVKEWKDKQIDGNIMPKFTLSTTVRKWGQIKTEVIGLECVKSEAQYVKYLISNAVEYKHLVDCIFVPIGIHLMKSSEVLSSLLRQHNHYVANISTFEIYGIYPQMLEKLLPGQNCTLRESITNSGYIKHLEKTPVTETKGVWMVITNSNEEQKAKEFMEKVAPKSTERPNNTIGNTNKQWKPSNKDQVVGNYANMLEKLACVTDTSQPAINSTEFDICKTLETRKSYKEMLTGMREKTSDAKQETNKISKETNLGQTEGIKSAGRKSNEERELKEQLTYLQEKMKLMESKYDQGSPDEKMEIKIGDIVRNTMEEYKKTERNRVAEDDRDTQMILQEHEDKQMKMIDEMMNRKMQHFELRQEKRFIDTSEKMAEKILGQVSKAFDVFQTRMEELSTRLMLQQQMHSDEELQLLNTQPPLVVSPNKEQLLSPQKPTPARDTSMRGVEVK